VCDGRELARYMAAMFDDDFDGSLDVKEIGPGAVPDFTPSIADVLPYRRYMANVMPLIAPDLAEQQYLEMLRSAQDRVLVQVLYIEEGWIGEDSLLSELISAAERGAQVRVLLDSAWSAKENEKVAEHLNQAALAGEWDLQAKLISPYHDLGLAHNKGMIVDDTAVVSSLNWCDNALRDNREVGLAITSKEVSGYFASVFWTDWSDDPYPPEMELPWYECTSLENVPIMIDASNTYLLPR